MDANERFELARKELNEATAACKRFSGMPLASIPSDFVGHDIQDMRKAFARLAKANYAFSEIGKVLHSKK